MLYKRLLLPCLFALLAGCASNEPPDDNIPFGQGNPALWSQYQQQLEAINSWSIQGKIGIHSPNKSGSGTLYWLQNQQSYDIRLAGPLGRGATHLSGQPGSVHLESGQGTYLASSPEELVDQQTGWQLPVSNLLYWIRGLPAPGSHARLWLNPDSQLALLQQDGWQVHYQSYGNFSGRRLPERLKLESPDLEVVLVIKQWQARTDQQ